MHTLDQNPQKLSIRSPSLIPKALTGKAAIPTLRIHTAQRYQPVTLQDNMSGYIVPRDIKSLNRSIENT